MCSSTVDLPSPSQTLLGRGTADLDRHVPSQLMDHNDALYDILDNRDELAQVLANVSTGLRDGRAECFEDEDECVFGRSPTLFDYVAPVDSHAQVLPELEIDFLPDEEERKAKEKLEMEEEGGATAPSSSSTSPSADEKKVIIQTTRQLIKRIIEVGADSTISDVPEEARVEPGLEAEGGSEETQNLGDGESSDRPQERTLRNGRFLLRLGLPIIPPGSPVCPTIKAVDESIEKRKIFFSVYSSSGYNFSNEFIRIYKGHLSWNTAKKDFRAILRRCLLSVESAMSNADADKFSEFILRVSLWECRLSIETSRATLSARFPDLKAKVETSLSFREVKVFVGKDPDTGQTFFWVRICFPLFSTIRYESNDEENALPEGLDDQLELCYMKKYRLSQKELDDLDIAIADSNGSFHDVPLPPPKESKPGEVGLYLLYDETLRDEQNFDQLLEDVWNDLYDVGVSMPKKALSQRSQPARPPSLAYLNVNSAYCSELIGWGDNSNFSLGLPTEGNFSPFPLPIPKSLALERIKQIACSPRHTLILSFLGNIYACGENTEGALGLGDDSPRRSFELVVLPNTEDAGLPPPVFVSVAAGSGSIGSHSMAIEKGGNLYSWGVAYCTGLGRVKHSVYFPEKVDTFPVDFDAISEATRREEQEADRDDGLDAEDQNLVVSVSCGAGFTAAVMKSGRVAVWGMWLHGRLGLGPTPQIHTGTRYTRQESKVAKFVLRPQYVPGLYNVREVACGEAHTLCIAGDGELFSWGQNVCGQLGTGVHHSGFLLSHTKPATVHPFCKSNPDFVPLVSVCAGAYHSLAIDERGGVWSWGARGAPCLGQADVELGGEWAKRVNFIYSQGTKLSRIMVPFELMGWTRSWASPRRIPLSGDVKISALSAGDMHSTLLTTTGQIYLWGAGLTIPRFINDEQQEEEEEEEGKDGVAEAKTNEEESGVASTPLIGDLVVSSPRCPSGVWLEALATRRASLVASAGSHVFVLLVDELVAEGMAKLYRRAVFGVNPRAKTMSETGSDDESLASGLYSQDSSSSVFDQRGRVDCMLLVGGKVLLAHKALLVQRSPVLRDLIFEEYSGIIGEITHVLLPDLHTDTAKALLYFIYTDVLPPTCTGNPTLLRNLSRCGRTFKIPRLHIICDHTLQAIASLNGSDGPSSSSSSSSSFSSTVVEYGLELPPSTLSRDLSNMLGDQQFGDVKFVAEGKNLFAHRFLLESRSEYFQAMFRGGMSESVDQPMHVISVVVPDSYLAFLRLLTFVYTNTIPAGGNDVLIEDLTTADRYNMMDMRLHCESMIKPDTKNWPEIYRVALQLDSQRLVRDVKSYLCEQTAALRKAVDGGLNSEYLGADVQELMEHIMEMRREAYPSPPSQTMIDLTVANAKSQQEFSNQKKFNIPYTTLAGAIIVAVLYPSISKVVWFSPIVPIVNGLMTIGVVYMGFRYISK